MLKNFNFILFLTTLGIASVAHAGKYDNTEDDFGSFNSNSFKSIFPPMPQGLLNSPVGFGRNFPSRSSSFSNFNLDEHMDNINSALSELRNSGSKLNHSNGPIINTIKKKECCDMNGNNCHLMTAGEICNGAMKKTKTSLGMAFGTNDPSKTPNNEFGDLKPTNDYSQILPQKNQQKPSRQPSRQSSILTDHDDDDEVPEQPSQSMSPSQMPNRLNKQAPNSKSLPTGEPSNTMDFAQQMKNLFGEQFQNASPTVLDDNDVDHENKKLVSDSFGRQSFIVMPKEKAAERHDYETPLNISPQEVETIRQQMLSKTNFYRKKHGLPLLKINNYINNHAQEWANHMAPTHNIDHRKEGQNKIYGENLYMTSMTLPNLGEKCIDAWYQELRFVEVGDGETKFLNNPKGEVGHLTALLWRKSKEMGVGVAKDERGFYYMVANYNPGGNVLGFFRENVPEFKQKDIDAAQEAYDIHKKENLTPKIVSMVYDRKTGKWVQEDGSEITPEMEANLTTIPGNGSPSSPSGMGSYPGMSSYPGISSYPGMSSYPGKSSPLPMSYPMRSGGYGRFN